MPFVSRSQQRYLFAKKPALAREYADATKDFKALPEKVTESKLDKKLKKTAYKPKG
jgi:hypothetical protein